MSAEEEEEVEKKIRLNKRSMDLDNSNDVNEELYIPGLLSPSLFQPLPSSDGLTPLLEKYLQPIDRPLRDLSGSNPLCLPLDALVRARSWHSVALHCQTAILSSSPEQTSFILRHWALRFHALLRLRLISHLLIELSALIALLPPSSFHHFPSTPPQPFTTVAPLFSPAVPFEMHVFFAASPALRGEKERSVEMFGDIIRAAKAEMWSAVKAGHKQEGEKWRNRAEAVGNIMAGVLLDLKAFESASSLLSTMTSPDFIISLCKLHVTSGDLTSFSDISQRAVTGRAARKTVALHHVAQGNWEQAEKEWRILVDEESQDAEARNNLAVVQLFSCQLSSAINILEDLISTSQASEASDTAFFNLATLLELRTEAATPAKVHLLRDVVSSSHGAEELRPSSLKLML